MQVISTFLDFLTPAARKIYLSTNGPSTTSQRGVEALFQTLNTVRVLHVIAELNGDLSPRAEYVAELAEMFNHGVAHGIFTSGCMTSATWTRMSDGRAMLSLYTFSTTPQEEISRIYGMTEAFRDTVCG